LKKYFDGKGIHVTAYSPSRINTYGKETVIDDEEAQKIAKEMGRTSCRVLIDRASKQCTSVIPKSITQSRIASNFERESLLSRVYWILLPLDRHNDPIEWGFDMPDERDEAYIKGAAKGWVGENWKKHRVAFM
ncbi:hypothetical protein HOY82DRAFT_485552, partial [Tuber indicum]